MLEKAGYCVCDERVELCVGYSDGFGLGILGSWFCYTRSLLPRDSSYTSAHSLQTWTMAMIFGERLERRFSAKLMAESGNHEGFLAGVAWVSTTWSPLLPIIRVLSQTSDQKRSMLEIDHW